MHMIHERSCINYTVTHQEIIKLDDDHDHHDYLHNCYEDNIQFLVKITYQTKRVSGYGHVLDSESPGGAITDVEFGEKKEAKAWLMTRYGIRNLYISSTLLKPTFIEIGVKHESVQDEIIKIVVDYGQSMINEYSWMNTYTGPPLMVPILVEMEKEKEIWMCDRDTCIAEMGWRTSDNIAESFLDVFKVGKSDKELGESCTVCLEDFGVGSCAAQMPDCMHMFHEDCIVNWLRQTPSCPVCRSRLFLKI